MTKKTILFVDDEPNILSGIRRMLRSMREEFNFLFAESGPLALEQMQENQVDVIVSDMRMPGMDGAQLLTEVQEHYPHVIRIMLTGQADEESVIRTVSVVHQFLAKPCEPKKLKEVLTRSGALHDLMTNIRLKEVVTGIGTLPSLPSVYAELQEVLRSSDVTAGDVAKVIEKDIAMTAKLLQLLNSSFFGLFKKVESPERAVTLLGLDTIKTLVLGVQVFSEMKAPPSSFSMENLWDHSILVAQCSKKVAAHSSEETELINNAFLAGMLHDIGRLLLVSKVSDSYVPLIERARDEGLLLLDLERETYGATHGDVGAYLTGLWGFNGDIVEAVAFHNDLSNYPGESFNPALAVHIADFFYHSLMEGSPMGAPAEMNRSYIDQLGLSGMVEEWEKLCRATIEGSRDENG